MTKRIFDFILSLNFIAIAILPMILIAIIIKISSTGPVIFWSLRSGSNNSTFNMPKFRTMFLDSPYVASNLLEDKHRYITPFGSFLRKTSLDELPQLWSILIGKMSFVGPRPCILNEVEWIEKRKKYNIISLKPGLTGLAQINGRDNLTINEKIEFEKKYLKNANFTFDIYILLITVLQVIIRKNISH